MGSVDKKLSRYKHLFDRIIEIYKFTPFELEDIRQIITELSEVKIEDEVIELIHKKANRFRQIVKLLIEIENMALVNGHYVIKKENLGW